ncbi:MAG: LacI family transcriptional regulator [Cytophagales bacterium]|nr:LacI family transcriptional regulator [Cytophagales bacterium]
MKSDVTIKDLARELNVSPSTVSRALKDHYSISPEMKRSVIELANRLHYTPNTIAQSLKQNRTHIIGVIIPEVIHYFFSTVIGGIDDVAYKRGYQVIVTQSNESYFREVANVNALVSSRVDGLLVSVSKETKDFGHFKSLQERKVPLVFFDRDCAELTNTSSVLAADYEGAFEAVEHLIQTGCRRIVHYAGPKTLKITSMRKQGYIDALRKHGLPVDESLIMEADNNEKAYSTTKHSLAMGLEFDGLFAVNDLTAIGAILALKEAGRRIPQDVSVIGFGDGPISTFTDPQLTTVLQPGFMMGQEAAELLIDELEAKDTTPIQSKQIKTRLVLRASSRR